MFDTVVDRFLAQSPLTVMARVVLDRLCDPTWVDALFDEHAEAQSQHTFSSRRSSHSRAKSCLVNDLPCTPPPRNKGFRFPCRLSTER